MSKTVAPEDIHAAASAYGETPFLLHAHNHSARVNHVVAHALDESTKIEVRGFGRGLASRLAPDTALSLLWPAKAEGDLSLIADGTAVIDPDDPELLIFTVVSAVMHRPAPVHGESSC